MDKPHPASKRMKTSTTPKSIAICRYVDLTGDPRPCCFVTYMIRPALFETHDPIREALTTSPHVSGRRPKITPNEDRDRAQDSEDPTVDVDTRGLLFPQNPVRIRFDIPQTIEIFQTRRHFADFPPMRPALRGHIQRPAHSFGSITCLFGAGARMM